MVSLLTNTSAMSALRTLTATQKAVSRTEDEVSTGLRVADASDDAAYWSISTIMRSQTGALAAIRDALSLTGSIADVTSAALKGVIDSTQRLQQDLVTAQQPGVDLTAVQTEISAQQNAIRQTAEAASFNGVNWLVGSDTFATTVDETETYDTDYATYRNILNHVSAPTTESTATVSHTATTTKTDGNGNISTVETASSGTVRFYGVYYFQPTITETRSGGLLPDFSLVPTSTGSAGTASSRVETTDMQLFTTSTNTTITRHTASWTDRTTTDNQADVFTEIHDDTTFGGSGIFGGSLGFSGGQRATLLGMDISDFDLTDLKAASGAVTTALGRLVGAAAAVAGIQAMIGNQLSFNSALGDALTSGIGSLVDADMNVASTRLRALQTQQQLGIEALSIANDNSVEILKLFG